MYTHIMNKIEQQVPCPGYSIAADWYENGGNETLMIVPGYQSSKARQGELVSAVALKHNFNALVIDFSGHGNSPFALSETRPAQHLLEAICVFDWLAQEKPEQKISLMGTSYGAFQLAYLSRFRDFRKLVLRTPAIYRPEDMYTLSGSIPRQDIAEAYRKDSQALSHDPLFLQKPTFTGETLVVVHDKDEDIPTATSDIYIKSFNADVYVAEGMHHWSHDPANSTGALEASFTAISEWLIKP